MCEPRFPKADFPHDSFRSYPTDFPSACKFLAERCPNVDAHCPIPNCPGANFDPVYEPRTDRKYSYRVYCCHCKTTLNHIPDLYKHVTTSRYLYPNIV